MSGYVDAEANAILEWYFRGGTLTPLGSLWLEMSTTTITAAGGNITPPVGNGYLRVQMPSDTTNWSATSIAPTLRQIYNLLNVAFPEATGPWGTLVDAALMSASSGGIPKVWGTLTTPRTITAPQTLIFTPGELIFKLPVG